MEISDTLDLNSLQRNSSYSEHNLHKILQNFLTILKIQLSKCKYKRVLEEIKAKENFYLDIPNGWKIREMKIKAMLKIIRKKLNKLETMHLTTLEQKMRSRSIKDWLNKIDLELQILLKEILLNPNANEEKELQIETITQLTLEELYLLSEYSKNEKCFRDCVGYLGLADRIICSFIPHSKDPKTVNIAQKCYLFISSMLISDSDYETALDYQVSCLNLCFRELFIRVDVLNGIDYENLSERRRYYFSKIFVHILICFYQRGVCQENLGNLVKAIESYRQSRFYAVKFLKEDFPLLTDFILSMEKRANSYHSIINNIKNKRRDDKIEDNNIRNVKETKRRSANTENIHKEKELEDNLHLTQNIVELELDPLKEKDEKIKYILSTVNLIDLLLSNNFKDILVDMKDLNISKLDIITLDIIQNRINEIRNEKIRINNRTNDCSPDPSVRKETNLEKNRKIHVRNFSSTCNLSNINEKTSLTSRPKLKVRKNSDNYNTYNCFHNQQHILKNYNQSTNDKVNDYVHDKYVFSQSFQKRVNFLQEYENKELNFQKQLLALKQKEKINFNDKSSDYKKDCELMFQRALSYRAPSNRNNNLRTKLNNKLSSSKLEEEKNIESREKLENCVIKSLNSGKFDEYKISIKNLKKVHVKNSSTTTKILENEKNKLCDNISVEIHNIKQFCKISNQIELLEKSERSANIFQNNSTIIPDLRRTFRNNKTKFSQTKNMDHFVKSIPSIK